LNPVDNFEKAVDNLVGKYLLT